MSVTGEVPRYLEEMFSEDLKVPEPISPYAASKSACEQICYTYCHLYGIRAVVKWRRQKEQAKDVGS